MSLKDRVNQNYRNKDGSGGKNILNLSELGDKVAWFKAKVGTNEIAIVPYYVATENHPQLKKGDEDYLLDVWVHRNIGPANDNILCLARTFSKPCPVCEEYNRLKDEGDTEDDMLNKLKPSRRCIYNVLDVSENKMKVFEASHYLFEKELLEESASGGEDGDAVIFPQPDEKYSIVFRGAETTRGKMKYLEYKSFRFKKHKEVIVTDRMIKHAVTFDKYLVIPTYEEVKATMDGVQADADAPEEAPAENKKEEKASEEKSESKDSGKKCPHSHKFGRDCDEHNDCATCDAWEDCADAKEKEGK